MSGPLILKFGGTSLDDADALERLAGIVASRVEARPVVVVSAMRGVTDALLEGTELARRGEVGRAYSRIEGQIGRYSSVAARLLDADAADELDAVVSAAALEITDLLRVVSLHPGTLSPRRDEIVSYGERLSSRLVARVLASRGVAARRMDARRCIVTDEDHGKAVPLVQLTTECTLRELEPVLAAGEVPVLGGFIGAAENGATTTLGRGGSDYTAALVGAALQATEIQIWTDVTGFLSADPRVVPDAHSIPHLSYAEAAELAYFGAKVLHPKTIQPAVERGIPVRVCNSHQPDAPGTLIDKDPVETPGGAKAIAHKPGITLIQVASARMLGAYGFLKAIFEVFARHRTAIDIVTTSEVSVSLSVEDVHSLPGIVEELAEFGTVRVESGYSVVCVVGEGLRYTAGLPARVFGTLGDVDVAIISQGASSINLTFVVPEVAAVPTVRRLHAEFFGQP
jgi:aspartate kinase